MAAPVFGIGKVLIFVLEKAALCFFLKIDLALFREFKVSMVNLF